MAYAEQWSTDPAQNTQAPPLGAPEGGLTWGRVSDTFRVVMAAVAELKETISDGTVPNAALAANSLKFAGRTRQQAYDDIWPVGSERAWVSASAAGLVPSGLTATWTLIAKDSLIVGADPTGTYATVGATVGTAVTADLSSDGAHTHGAVTGSVALTPAQLGSNLDATPVVEAATGTTRRLVRVAPEVDATEPLSGATSHSHSIASGGVHTHTVTLPKRYVTAWFRRTA